MTTILREAWSSAAPVPRFSFPCEKPSFLFLLHRIHLFLQSRNIRMNLLHRRLKSLRECKTNQPVISAKSGKGDLIESLSTSVTQSMTPYMHASEIQRLDLSLYYRPDCFERENARCMHAIVIVQSSILVYWPPYV